MRVPSPRAASRPGRDDPDATADRSEAPGPTVRGPGTRPTAATSRVRRAPGAPTAPATDPVTGSTRAVTTYTVGRFSGPVRPAVVSTTSRERFAERARARRNLARRQVVGGAAGVVGVGALGWLLLLSPVLALDVTQLEVTGAGTVVAVDQVVAVVHERAGTPLPRLDTVGLRDRVLEVPGVREARVVRQWPRGLAVQLVSREPVAAVPEEAPATGLVLLDEQGVQVGRADAAPAGLPVVDVPVGDERTLSAVLHVLEQLPPDLLGQVASVAAASQDTVTMQLRDGGPRIDWGSAEQTPLKLAVLAALRAAPEAAGASVFDVSAPQMPITK
ncbi:FtsQ-type POTRA domain-containing protein [Cellulomonas sp. zg-ZUI199]|uniref:FtsQ-type POTRA domain-containing protein n=1 Tax=Cellulomonas wangleii TaxID=2816956 RepID=A0ABX8D8L8_9CELL|nr:FtsQ-type POTRA domain-containing protein [Cellulomonas wangleii]QVI63773.1 FtsQ-type POTRA domain-containing protein [Cellulomonas wangleii]